ncbi:MAG: hypothetical protein JSS75_12300 [Bacteroidetes bacterium]|nr:hypothetical protein [Bacteroidota bacterium]
MVKPNKKFITIGFDASREPLDEMFWCEADVDGDWTNITVCDRIRTRREVVERIAALDKAVIGIDTPLSFPKGFLEHLKASGVVADHAALTKRIREDLKKNTDDGIRKWIDLMGVYRETKTETPDEAFARFTRNAPPRNDGRRRRQLEAHELRTMVERFRRPDRILRRDFPDAVASTLGIQYNRLTRRYEFTSANARGRTTLVAISMLEQVREAKPEVAIWPFQKPADVTIVEVFPKLFEDRFKIKPSDLRAYFDAAEDNALYVSKEVRDQVYAHEKAREACISLLGLLSSERREIKTLRPLRDYRDTFYASDEVQLEGWIYGIGYKEPNQNEPKGRKQPARQHTIPTEAPTAVAEVPAEVAPEPTAVTE